MFRYVKKGGGVVLYYQKKILTLERLFMLLLANVLARIIGEENYSIEITLIYTP